MVQIRAEADSKNMGLKRGLTNVRHNEDFHLIYSQFFQAVANISPVTVKTMIQNTLTAAKSSGRVLRSPLRLLFNSFLQLQNQRLLWPQSSHSYHHENSLQGSGVNVITAAVAVFPDRLDWVEFLDFVSKVEVDELVDGDASGSGCV